MKKSLGLAVLFIFAAAKISSADIITLSFTGNWHTVYDGSWNTIPDHSITGSGSPSEKYFVQGNAFEGSLVYRTESPNVMNPGHESFGTIGRYWLDEFELYSPDSEGVNRRLARDSFAQETQESSNARFEVANNHGTQGDFLSAFWKVFAGDFTPLGHLTMPSSLSGAFTESTLFFGENSGDVFASKNLPEFLNVGTELTSVSNYFETASLVFKFGSEEESVSGQINKFAVTRQQSPVPEPSTVILFTIGLTGLGAINRKKDKSLQAS